MSRLKGKSFEILSVSVDATRGPVAPLVKAAKAPGIHTWDEKDGKNPIATLYNARQLPKWFLLDQNGVIRARDTFGAKLIPAIKVALAPAKTDSGGATIPKGGAPRTPP